MKSMTGFGRAEVSRDGHILSVEARSVNHRYLELNIRIPHFLGSLEGMARQIVKDKLQRGKVDLYVTYLNHSQAQGEVFVSEGRMEAYLTALRKAGEAFSLEDDLKLSHLLSLPDVMSVEAPKMLEEIVSPLLKEAAEKALDQLNEMRLIEGETIRKDLEEKLSELEKEVAAIEEAAPLVPKMFRERLEKRMEEVLSQAGRAHLEDGRLEAEVALFADKCAIDEEITRLHSHIAQYRQLLTKSEGIGRQLDFLTQELNREANTVSSKANQLEITRHALQMKNIIEKLREQIQNIE